MAIVSRGRFLVIGLDEPTWATSTGRLSATANDATDMPAVGDWVALRDGRIASVLPRSSCFVRKAAGESAAQVVCTNVDVVFVVAAIGRDFNLRRLERYIAAVWSAGAEPVVAINKIDLEETPGAARAQLAATMPHVAVACVSALERTGLEALDHHLRPGRTAAFVGSSGVGKSSLINGLLGEDARLETGAVRAGDDKGRHTTTHRELLSLPSGALVIDTPGMREFGLWDAEAGLERAFADIEELASSCRFGDCQHAGEPDCSVADAIAVGELDGDRFASYQRLRREVAYEARRSADGDKRRNKKKGKAIAKGMRVRNKLNRRLGLKDW